MSLEQQQTTIDLRRGLERNTNNRNACNKAACNAMPKSWTPAANVMLKKGTRCSETRGNARGMAAACIATDKCDYHEPC